MNFKKIKHFLEFTLLWVSSNLAVPFWTIGHVHLSLNVYQDIQEIAASIGMNLIVFIGFLVEYKKHKTSADQSSPNID